MVSNPPLCADEHSSDPKRLPPVIVLSAVVTKYPNTKLITFFCIKMAAVFIPGKRQAKPRKKNLKFRWVKE